MGNNFDENNNMNGTDPIEPVSENNEYPENNSAEQASSEQGFTRQNSEQSNTAYPPPPEQQDNTGNPYAQQQNNTGNPYAQQQNYYQYPPYNNQQQPQSQTSYTPYNAQNPYDFTSSVPQTPKKRMSGGSRFLAVLLSIAIVISGVAIGMSVINRTSGPATQTEADGKSAGGVDNGPSLDFSATPTPGEVTNESGELSATDVYKKIYESSVGILVYSKKEQMLATEGSGVIMGEDNDGEYTYIITCAHVISGNDISIRIQLHDGTEYDAQIVGYDTRTDIGVVRTRTTGLKAAEFGDSSALQVGQTVYAIGNPGGTEFAGSFTQGMVSAIDRPVSSSSSGYTMECIQHHAAINPGNSGGALVNGFGQVVGINSMKIVDDYEGMGFAVPSRVFQKVVDELILNGYVPNRPKLGISYSPATEYRVYSMVVQIKGLPSGSIVIQEIAADSSLNDTEVAVYDMIVAVNGEDMTSSGYLAAYIENSKVGDKLTLSIVRVLSDYSIKEFDVKVTLIEDKGTSNLEPGEEETTPNYDYLFPFDF